MHYNIFNQVHLPLKLALVHTSVYLDNVDLYKHSALAQLSIKVGQVLSIFREQVNFEENFILPLVSEYEPSIADKYLRHHKKQSSLAYELEGYISLFKNFTYESRSFSVIKLFNELFNAFIIDNYLHMDDEEEVLNSILRLYYSDDFLKLVEQNMKMSAALISQMNPNILQAAKAA